MVTKEISCWIWALRTSQGTENLFSSSVSSYEVDFNSRKNKSRENLINLLNVNEIGQEAKVSFWKIEMFYLETNFRRTNLRSVCGFHFYFNWLAMWRRKLRRFVHALLSKVDIPDVVCIFLNPKVFCVI